MGKCNLNLFSEHVLNKYSDAETYNFLIQAEKEATSFTELMYCETLWCTRFKNAYKTQRCLLLAEQVARTTTELNDCACEWLACFKKKEKPRAIRIILRAETLCKTFEDHIDCARAWAMPHLEMYRNVCKCMNRAQDIALKSNTYALVETAFQWRFFDYEFSEYAEMCIMAAENRAEKRSDWLMIANYYNLQRDPNSFARCMRNAMDCSDTLLDWIACMHRFNAKSPGENNPLFQRCMIEIRKRIENPEQWLLCLCQQRSNETPSALNDYFLEQAGIL